MKNLPDGYSLHTRSLDALSGTLLDTFEGHMRKSAQLLLQSPGTLALIDLVSGGLMRQDASPGWMFAAHLPAGPVADRLPAHSTLRAFSDVCSAAADLHELIIMDELEKTVVRGRIMVLSHEQNHATLITPVPYRGYDEELIRVSNALTDLGFAPFDTSCDYFPLLGIEQEPYTSKPDVMLSWDEAVYESANRIAVTFIRVAQQNEAGIIDDTDTEFLHDFRVSLRRVRSLLSLFRNVYNEQDCADVQKQLAEIMLKTSRLRDLDVYLMDRRRFHGLVPDSMHAGLDILFDLFAKERQSAFETVRGFLQDGAYRESMDEVQQRFQTPDGMARGSAANEAGGHFAGRMIMKRYGKVAKIARSINSSTPDDTVHALRIHCKKLRYLMEFFSPLYASDSVKPLVKALKGLQDGLGHFNDCSVQRAALNAFVSEHPMRGRKGIVLAESVGALVATLYQMQLRARLEIDAALGRFANDRTNRDFKALFAGGGTP